MGYGVVILISWGAFIVVWAIGALSVKRDVVGGGFSTWWARGFLLRLLIAFAVVFIALRISTGSAHYSGTPLEFKPLFALTPLFGWIAAVLTMCGVGIAIWARVYLGRNWSGAPSVKEDHELVTSGPYAYVRHPIYTGVILAALGSAATGTVFGIGTLIAATVIFLLRIKKEEQIMTSLFPEEYPKYQMRTKKLIPFVW